MRVTFEGHPPYQLSTVLDATVQFSGETVEMTLFLLNEHEQLVPVRVPMSIPTAQNLGLALRNVAFQAERAQGRG